MPLVVYTKRGCPWCDGVRQLLTDKHVAYEEREVRDNPEFFAELVAKSQQELTPTLDLNGEILADTDAEAVAIWLKEKGLDK